MWALSLTLPLFVPLQAFQMPTRYGGTFSQRQYYPPTLCLARDKDNTMASEALKIELSKYLAKRAEVNADVSAKQQVGRVVGGTKGNAVLEFISGSPNKEKIIEDAPDVFDYTELERYGFGYLVTPIMNAGGRIEMYNLMNMPVPKPRARAQRVKKAPELVIDREGKNDEARYSGLKVSQIIDDAEMGRQLEEALRKQKEGKELRKKLQEEMFEAPFADKRNTSAQKMTPDWTPERLDEEGRRVGQAMAWARKARAGEFKKDPYELMNIEGALQIYSFITTPFVAFAFGTATRSMCDILNFDTNARDGLLDALQPVALAIVVVSMVSSIYCIVQAPIRNRSSFVWAIKGYAGGPFAVLQLKNLNPLVTRGESENGENAVA
mmetsp:Transcript_4447/g.8552  ORF Transcript_4447/g.8552 Transcript_4447/m.8552 type:complete len:380 (-) Transcript_4447:23-1162(-)